jgi:hypothetical protein
VIVKNDSFQLIGGNLILKVGGHFLVGIFFFILAQVGNQRLTTFFRF